MKMLTISEKCLSSCQSETVDDDVSYVGGPMKSCRLETVDDGVSFVGGPMKSCQSEIVDVGVYILGRSMITQQLSGSGIRDCRCWF